MLAKAKHLNVNPRIESENGKIRQMVCVPWQTPPWKEPPNMGSGFRIVCPDVWLQVETDQEALNDQTEFPNMSHLQITLKPPGGANLTPSNSLQKKAYQTRIARRERKSGEERQPTSVAGACCGGAEDQAARHKDRDQQL